jgi:hypothetical protein
MRPLAALLALALLAPLPLAAAQDPQVPDAGPTDEATRPAIPITFYGHVFGNTARFPMPANTVPPIGDDPTTFWQDHQCFDDPTGALANSCDEDLINKLILFATAGPVQVHSADRFNYSQLHNERGRAKDVFLDPTQDVEAWFYAAADYFSWPLICRGGAGLPPNVPCPWPQWGWDPGIVPNFVVEATLYHALLGEYGQGASEPPPILEAWQSGEAEVVAHGATEPADLQTGLPGSPNVQEFRVNLGKPQVTMIPKEHDFFIVYSWYELVNGQKVGVEYMKPWAGEQFPVRFTIPVRNPFDVELVVPQFLHDKVVIHGVLSTPWGSYDVDQDTAVLEITDAAGQPVQAPTMVRFGDYQVAHGAHFKPVNFTWVWDHKADGASAGAYKAVVRACNYMNNACAATEAAFALGPGGSPGSVQVGRSGQVTATDALLRDLTSGAALGGAAPPLREGVQPASSDPAEAPKQAPGAGAALAALAALGAALARKRRAQP